MHLNLPNTLTLFRIFLVPLLVVVLLTPPWATAWVRGQVEGMDTLAWVGDFVEWLANWREVVAVVIFLVAAATDWLDGFLARRRGEVTTLGTLLDPIVADELLDGFGLHRRGRVRLAPALDGGRHRRAGSSCVSGVRGIAASGGVVIAARVGVRARPASQVVRDRPVDPDQHARALASLRQPRSPRPVGRHGVGDRLEMIDYLRHFFRTFDRARNSHQLRVFAHIPRTTRARRDSAPAAARHGVAARPAVQSRRGQRPPLVRGCSRWDGDELSPRDRRTGWRRSRSRRYLSLLLTALAIYLLGLVAGDRPDAVDADAGRVVDPADSALVKGIYGLGPATARRFRCVRGSRLLEGRAAGVPARGSVDAGFRDEDGSRAHDPIARGEKCDPDGTGLCRPPEPHLRSMILVPTSDLRELDVSIGDAIERWCLADGPRKTSLARTRMVRWGPRRTPE